MAKPEKISGKVALLRFTSHVSGSENTTGTSHIAVFKIGDQPITLELSSVPILAEGDQVDVIGSVSRGVFYGSGYFNRTEGVWDCRSGIAYLLTGLVFAFIGLIFLFTMWFVALFLFAAVYWLMRQWRYTRDIKKTLLDDGVDANEPRPSQGVAAPHEKREPPLTRDFQ